MVVVLRIDWGWEKGVDANVESYLEIYVCIWLRNNDGLDVSVVEKWIDIKVFWK